MHAAGDAAVDEADAALAEHVAAPDRIAIIRVAAVDQKVAAREQHGQFVDRLLGRAPGRNHHPYDARRGQRVDELAERRDRGDRFGGQRLANGSIGVVAADARTAARKPPCHVGTHASQPHDADVHVIRPVLRMLPKPAAKPQTRRAAR